MASPTSVDSQDTGLFPPQSHIASAPIDPGEEYDVASLLCARFGLESQEKDYIIVGSQTGQLSIYYPHRRGYDATDLLLETQMVAPIIGLYAGKFSG